MSSERIGIVSTRGDALPPSQTCVLEFEDVLSAMLNAPIVTPTGDADTVRSFDRLIYVALDYWQLSRLLQRSARLRRRSGPACAFVFDSFHRYLQRWTDRFPAALHPLARLARHELRTLARLQRIFMPVGALLDEQQAYLGVPLSYLPIGVDAVRFGSERVDRTIDVNAYGRQPPVLNHSLADRINVRDGRYRYYHTDHVALGQVTDPVRHRRLFWRMLTDSRIALAYSGEAYDPAGRFDAPFVGQRWYESAAAGCVIMGQAPSGADAAALFDWPDALIDLPPEPDAAWEAIRTMLDQPDRLAAIGRRNHRHALARHDWRCRVDRMAEVLGLPRDASFLRELARATPPAETPSCAG